MSHRILKSITYMALGSLALAACSAGTESSSAVAKMRTKNGALIPLCGSTNTNLNNLPINSNLLSNQNIINSNQNNLNIPTNNNPSNSCIINNSNLINNLPTTTSTTTIAPNITTPQIITTPPTTLTPPTTMVVTVSTPTTPPTTAVVAVSTPVTTVPKCVVIASQSSVKWCKPATSWRLFVEVKNRPAAPISGSNAAGVMASVYRPTGFVTALAATVTFKDSTRATFVFKGIGTPTEIFPK